MKWIIIDNNLKPKICSDGEPFIYAVLNWENPLKSTIVMAGSLILMCVVYFLVFLMQKGRTKVFNKYFVEEMKSIV